MGSVWGVLWMPMEVSAVVQLLLKECMVCVGACELVIGVGREDHRQHPPKTSCSFKRPCPKVAVGNNIHVFAVAGDALAPSKVLEGHRGLVGCLAYSPDGALLAAGDANREIKVWDRAADWAAKVSGKWVFHTSAVKALAWAPSGRFLASGSFDQGIFLWSLEKPMKKRQIKFAHKGGVNALAYLDEATLVSCGNDGGVGLWNVTPPE